MFFSVSQSTELQQDKQTWEWSSALMELCDSHTHTKTLIIQDLNTAVASDLCVCVCVWDCLCFHRHCDLVDCRKSSSNLPFGRTIKLSCFYVVKVNKRIVFWTVKTHSRSFSFSSHLHGRQTVNREAELCIFHLKILSIGSFSSYQNTFVWVLNDEQTAHLLQNIN